MNHPTNLNVLSITTTFVSFVYKKHTIQQQQLSHFSHRHNFLTYPNTNHSLTPQIPHRQETLTIINTKHIHPQMITSHVILTNYIKSLSFTLTDINYPLINCYLASGKTSIQTSQRITVMKTLIFFYIN